jgi:hypothetical protein
MYDTRVKFLAFQAVVVQLGNIMATENQLALPI